jgi:glutamine amidotransferase
MCELMGLSFARPVSADFSIRAFAPRGEHNAHGWGLGWYPDRALAIVKEPNKWADSPFATFLETYPHLRSHLYIAHVRHKTTGGEPTYADTHPFAREFGGRDYCFAHNGTLDGPIWDLTTHRYRPIGSTDSERAFCRLLDALSERVGHLDEEDHWRWLHRQFLALNQWGKLNVLMSDGRHLFAYHCEQGWKGLTFRRLALGPHQARRFEDADLTLDLEVDRVDPGYIVATCPLGGSGWHRFQPSEMLVFLDGQVRFSSHRDRTAPELAPSRY